MSLCSLSVGWDFTHRLLLSKWKLILILLFSLPLSLVPSQSPGLYFGEDDESCPRHLRGLGVRIEDDVVIREHGGPLILSAHTPKSVCEVEEACAQSEGWRAAPGPALLYSPWCVLVPFKTYPCLRKLQEWGCGIQDTAQHRRPAVTRSLTGCTMRLCVCVWKWTWITSDSFLDMFFPPRDIKKYILRKVVFTGFHT